MKRVIAILIAVAALTAALVADEEVLIDFDQLIADYTLTDPILGDRLENQRTLVDFSIAAGGSFTDAEKALMKTSLAIKNWEVRLSSSSRTVRNQTLTFAQQARVREDARESSFPGKYVMGIRVHFPTDMYHGWALIKPPFEIPAYQDKTTVGSNGQLEVSREDRGKGDMYTNIGVIKNVSVVKSVSMNVYGLNFPHKISVLIKNAFNEEMEMLMGHLQFDGWRKLVWDNPNYIIEVRNRDLRVYPLYPRTSPMIKLTGIRVYRDGMHEGEDFIGYIKDISVVFDKAFLDTQRDIDDEEVWGILQQREDARRQAELRRLGNIQVLRYLESLKMHRDEEQ